MTTFELLSILGISSILGAFIYIGKKLKTLDDLERTTEKIKVNVKVISDYLTTASVDFNHKELKAYSPLNLTKEGDKLISSLGFDKVFKSHKDDFFTFIDSQEPKLKYDVENAAIQSVSGLQDMDYMNFLKVFFYNNPDRSMKNVAPTLGVYIRDKYLQAHPEIKE
jgi:hypothetical protein